MINLQLESKGGIPKRGPRKTASHPRPAPDPATKLGPPAGVPRQSVEPAASPSLPPRESAFTLYMKEVGEIPLLTPQEEIDLAARIRKGDAEARDRMIRANLRLVVKIARDYENLGLPLLDLINEGNIGLMKAVEKFDPRKGGKLSTYGAWWIKQSIRRGLANQGKTIRLPVHVVDKLTRVRRTALQLQEKLRREPTETEIAEASGLSLLALQEMRNASVRPASLDAPLGDDDTNPLSEVVLDEHADSPYERLESKTTVQMLRGFVDSLNPREASILKYRFGLDGGTERTLEEVGHRFGVTRERIRQLQNAALSKLKRMILREEAA